MNWAVKLNGVGKRFRNYHQDAPATIHEAFMRGFRKLLPAEKFWGLENVSLNIRSGQTVGIVGRNGAGKSTLLRLIGGVGRPDAGTIEVQGSVRALLHLGAGFHPDLTGRENTLVSGVISGMTLRETKQKFDSIVEFAELSRFMDSPLRTYSSGMQMRLAFSIAIHSTPDIMLIDEVLAVGDIPFQQKCLARIAELKATGCTILIVSHDAGMLLRLCDETIWLDSGKVAAHGPTPAVMAQYLEQFSDAPAKDAEVISV
jgi:lipopolysaccharide transport system ATP-binding protein